MAEKNIPCTFLQHATDDVTGLSLDQCPSATLADGLTEWQNEIASSYIRIQWSYGDASAQCMYVNVTHAKNLFCVSASLSHGVLLIHHHHHSCRRRRRCLHRQRTVNNSLFLYIAVWFISSLTTVISCVLISILVVCHICQYLSFDVDSDPNCSECLNLCILYVIYIAAINISCRMKSYRTLMFMIIVHDI